MLAIQVLQPLRKQRWSGRVFQFWQPSWNSSHGKTSDLQLLYFLFYCYYFFFFKTTGQHHCSSVSCRDAPRCWEITVFVLDSIASIGMFIWIRFWELLLSPENTSGTIQVTTSRHDHEPPKSPRYTTTSTLYSTPLLRTTPSITHDSPPMNKEDTTCKHPSST